MRRCKWCEKPLEMALSGVRDFCNNECKKAHRKAYMADLMQKKRSVSILDGYSSINSQNVSKSNPHEKPICERQKAGLGLGEGNFTLKITKEGESIAEMYCPEYLRKKKEGYCIREHLPHEIECQFCINEQIRLREGEIFNTLSGEAREQ